MFMLKSFLIPFLFLLTTLLVPLQESVLSRTTPTPLPPESGFVEDAAPEDVSAALTSLEKYIIPTPAPLPIKNKVMPRDYPVAISLPSLNQTNKVEKVGVNSKGEMEVPDGTTQNVGWWQDGTVPGEVGSAVIDAHVYAAFQNLRYLKIGAAVYVTMASGKMLHFAVEDSRLSLLSQVPLDFLFNRADTQRLNFITCAGKLTADHTTYTKRLIVYTKLIK